MTAKQRAAAEHELQWCANILKLKCEEVETLRDRIRGLQSALNLDDISLRRTNETGRNDDRAIDGTEDKTGSTTGSPNQNTEG